MDTLPPPPPPHGSYLSGMSTTSLVRVWYVNVYRVCQQKRPQNQSFHNLSFAWFFLQNL